MKAYELYKDLIGPELRLHVENGDKDSWKTVEIAGVTDDSRKVGKDFAFFALKGMKADGHDLVEEAVRRGSAVLCVEDVSRVPPEYEGLVLEAENTREIFAKACYRFADSPAEGWLNVGVTGTNGKTTVTHMIEHVFNRLGVVTGVIGTVDHHLGSARWPARLTTPDPAELAARLRDFSRLGAKALAMEVSSHALAQRRADGIPFNIGVFTNLTRDHLDFHYDMDDYFGAKLRLFAELIPEVRNPKGAVINVDDEYGRRLASRLKIPVVTFGREEASVVYEILEETFAGTKARLNIAGTNHELMLSVPCRHNLQNALAALGAALAAGLDKVKALEALADFTGVRGRLEAVPNSRGVHVFVDYAHTDDALKSVLSSLSAIGDRMSPRPRMITVFGCGGDRDRGKRQLMFEAASGFSDVVVATSDNPRTEDPNRILDDVLARAKKEDMGARVFREPDRRRAIGLALEKARPGDVVLIAGKGHEEYQILGTQRLEFSDQAAAREILAGLSSNKEFS
jgi:UDP-N-acetylmuramoyl-L-alanyl-D-glutamate--2,6-diaminopimelate ligase